MEYLVVVLALYFVPAIVAYKREHNSALAILMLDLLLGWSLLGWIAALVWACTGDTRPRIEFLRRAREPGYDPEFAQRYVHWIGGKRRRL